jgi:hypothetical protein
VLLVNHDHAEIGHWREHGRARPDDDPALSAPKESPGIGAFTV